MRSEPNVRLIICAGVLANNFSTFTYVCPWQSQRPVMKAVPPNGIGMFPMKLFDPIPLKMVFGPFSALLIELSRIVSATLHLSLQGLLRA